MRNLAKLVVALLFVAVPMTLVSCSKESKDPAIATCKEFIKKAATGDKSFKDIIDFEAAAAKYGTSEKDVVKNEGKEKWSQMQEDMVSTITTTFSQVRGNYGSAFKDFKVDEKGKDYWIVSYKNPINERKMMKVRNVGGKMKAYFYSKS